MAATTTWRDTDFAGLVPGKGTFGMKANKLVLGRTIVTVDADGRATPGVDGEGFNAVGVAASTIDNRTAAPSGGAADAIDVEVEYGVFGFAVTGTAPEPGQVLFVVDNQTVSTDSDSGARGIAGFCTEYRDSVAYVYMGPHVAGTIVIAASEASQLDTAQADIDDLQAHVLSDETVIPLDLGSFLISGTTPLAAFADGASATPGWALDDSEAQGIRWNNNGTHTPIVRSVMLPVDLDDAADIVVHVAASKTGATDADDTTFTIAAYFQTIGALRDADANAGGATSAMVGTATSKTVQEVTRTIAAADVPAGPCVLTLSIQPTSAVLATDDVTIHAIWLEYTPQLLA